MDAHKLWMLRDFIGTNKVLFRIPVYQRNYDWSESNCNRLLDDIYGIMQSGDKHFLGTIVFMAAKSGGFALREYIIIDGQQRLTTLMLILKALSVVAESVGDDCYHEILLSTYLFMYFNRPEFDRYARFNSWGSARETFSWEDMCDIDIELPSINIQQKYVDIYNAMLANQRCCECGLDDLRMICTAYIEALRKKGGLKRIGDYIRPYNEKNTDGSITLEQGINIEKQFITPQRSNTNFRGRKIVRKGMFSYCTQLNNENVAIAYRTDEDCVVSSVYDVFEIIDKKQLVPEYLMLWLIRPEFGRFVYWASEGSAYEFLNYNNLADYRIPVPDIKVQQEIANIYNSYTLRREINEQMKRQIKDICPILIKGSMEEGGRI